MNGTRGLEFEECGEKRLESEPLSTPSRQTNQRRRDCGVTDSGAGWRNSIEQAVLHAAGE